MKHIITPALFAASAGLAHADSPNVITDIAPVHALVSKVMEGVGTPDLVIPPASSPHHYAMRPSEARALSQADLVVWVGHSLTPWLEGPIENLAEDAKVLELVDVDGVHLLGFREGALFAEGGHDHGHGHDNDHEDEHGDDHEDDHEDHDDEDGHKDDHEDDHDGHDHEADHKEDHKDDHDDHDHKDAHADDHDDDHEGEEASDPHVWLDPDNGSLFLEVIAKQLAEMDPENAAVYLRNAKEGQAELADVKVEIETQLASVRGVPFIVLHDGFHYFEHHFEIEAIGAISASDAQSPGAARVSALREALPDSNLKCAFSEPQAGERMLQTVIEGMDVKVTDLDPLGVNLELGSGLYPELLKSMGAAMATCLADD